MNSSRSETCGAFVGATRFAAWAGAVILAIVLSGCQTTGSGGAGASTGGECAVVNALTASDASGCTVYKEARSADGATDAEIERVIVFLHGDLSNGPSDYMHDVAAVYADRFNEAGLGRFVILSPLRQGFRDKSGNASSGHKPRSDLYQSPVIDQMQGFLAAMRARFPNAKVTLVGHSGGAATAGIIAGRAPALADAFVLVGTPWNIPYWRTTYRTNSRWPKSLSPHDFASRTRPDQKFVIVGSIKDDSTPLPLAHKQRDQLRELGRDVELIELNDSTHNQLTRRTETIRAIARVSAP